MENKEQIEIIIDGRKGANPLSPDNFDIKELRELLDHIEPLLISSRKERPVITYSIENGSVKNIFTTSYQTVLLFSAIISSINEFKNIDNLDVGAAKSIEYFQESAKRNDYAITLASSISDESLTLDAGTNYYRHLDLWLDSEFYFYGQITKAGGKDKSNIQILTEDFGLLSIETPHNFLENCEKNILYKTYGVRAMGKQHIKSGEIDRSELKFVELVNYKNKYDEQYLNSLIDKASVNWSDVKNPDTWLNEIRGGEYEQ